MKTNSLIFAAGVLGVGILAFLVQFGGRNNSNHEAPAAYSAQLAESHHSPDGLPPVTVDRTPQVEASVTSDPPYVMEHVPAVNATPQNVERHLPGNQTQKVNRSNISRQYEQLDKETDSPASVSTRARSLHEEQPAPRVFPEDAVSKIWQVLSSNQQMNFTSIDRVICQPTICEIRFTGGPDLSHSAGLNSLLVPMTHALPMIKSGMMSSRVELAPRVYGSIFVIRTYIGDELLAEQKTKRP